MADVTLNERYEASMVLSGVGDAVGFRNGSWEFCTSGARIHSQLHLLGGLAQITVDSMSQRFIFCHFMGISSTCLAGHFTDLQL